MLKKIVLLIASVLVFSCGKKETPPDCSGNGCQGTKTVYLNNSDQILFKTKDTTFKFINTNDTILLVTRMTYTTFIKFTGACECTNLATNINSQFLDAVYVLKNKNIALDYHIGVNYLNNLLFTLSFSDTNDVIHQIYTTPYSGSTFVINNVKSKKNDFDSINIQGKYYYNIITNFDVASLSSNASITNVFFSKNFGIIRFTYNGIVYDIL